MVQKRCQHKKQQGIRRKDGGNKRREWINQERWTCSINKAGDHIGHCQSVPVKLSPYYSTWGAPALTTSSFIDRWSTKPINLSSPLSFSAAPFTSPFRPAPGGRGWHNLSLSSSRKPATKWTVSMDYWGVRCCITSSRVDVSENYEAKKSQSRRAASNETHSVLEIRLNTVHTVWKSCLKTNSR